MEGVDSDRVVADGFRGGELNFDLGATARTVELGCLGRISDGWFGIRHGSPNRWRVLQILQS